MKTLKGIMFALALPALLVLLWWAATLGTKSFFIPAPGTLFSTFADTPGSVTASSPTTFQA